MLWLWFVFARFLGRQQILSFAIQYTSATTLIQWPANVVWRGASTLRHSPLKTVMLERYRVQTGKRKVYKSCCPPFLREWGAAVSVVILNVILTSGLAASQPIIWHARWLSACGKAWKGH